MKNVTLGNFVEERINENKGLFTEKELNFINNNKDCINKIYLLGSLNSIQCYKDNKFNN